MLSLAIPANNKDIKIDSKNFLELFKEDKAVLVDIRMPFEKKVWSVNFSINLSPQELEKDYETLPKDKIIVLACPNNGRSPFAIGFLKEKGYEVKYLEDGLLGLMSLLKGEVAKNIAQII